MTAPSPTLESLATAEVLRIYERYQLELVEAFNLCPWAERARRDGQISQHVVFDAARFSSASLEVIDLLEPQAHIEIGLIILPTLRVPRHELERMTSELVETDRERRGLTSSPFALAAFHPEAEADTRHAERLIPFLRRSPDPTIQLVRMSALERVRAGSQEGTAFVDVHTLDLHRLPQKPEPSLRERIARANLRTIERAGLEHTERILLDIRRDRAESYRRVGLE